MKKLRLLLALFVASIGAMQSAWAERVSPVFPNNQAKTLESGQSYFLYNPGSDRFIFRESSYAKADPNSRDKLVVTNLEDNLYTLQLEGGYYFYSYGNNVNYSYRTLNDQCKFRISSIEGGYTIQRNYSYDETQFVGNATGNNYIYSNFTGGNIVWQLYDEEGADAIIRYRAKKALYDALVSAENYSLSFALEDYETLYANDETTNEELTAAAETINKALTWTDKSVSDESEYFIYTEPTGIADWNGSNGSYIYINNGEGGLKAVVEVDQEAMLVYDYGLSNLYNPYTFSVYLDGTLYQTINNYEGKGSEQKYFVELTAGKHVVEWVAICTFGSSFGSSFYLHNIAVYKTPTITVNLTQAGSLGTEVLYNVDHVKDVRKLIVKGKMNAEDWERINMMTGMFELDLTDTDVESLPQVQSCEFLRKIHLPTGLKTIENEAFKNTNLESVVLPEGLTTIGNEAFYNTRIAEITLPETVTSVGRDAFQYNKSLQKVVWSSRATSIRDYCFNDCSVLNEFTMPEGVIAIGDYAFSSDYNADIQLPSTVRSIGRSAFYHCDAIENLYIPVNAAVGYDAFNSCSNLKYVKIGEGASFGKGYYSSSTDDYGTFYKCTKLEEIDFPTSFDCIDAIRMLSYCTALKKVFFRSPTLVGGDKYTSFFSGLGTDLQVYVPSYLVNAYKLDKYWYNYDIMGFSTADVTDWTIKGALTFGSQDRFEGTPDILVTTTGGWTINGYKAQNIHNLTTRYWTKSSGPMDGASKIVANCDNVTITGKYQLEYYAYNYISRSSNYDPGYGRWHFICLPFDIKVSDITTDNNARFAVRYYDGANRAADGTGNSWKDYDADAVIPAGTGFIIQASKETKFFFTALDNESKQNAVSNNMFVKALEANISEQASNKGWNLVGNPWMSYYNIHKLNFTAPITVYDGYNKKYAAYSVIDDDYAILPTQAFFVQCPDEVTEISFPVDGRQVTDVIESQNAARAAQPSERKLIDLYLSNNEQADKTRFVLNPQASMDYETTCDASKFVELGSSCPQVYTIEQGEPLAINERPLGDGTVALGVIIPKDGIYTLSTTRNQFKNIVLVDNETGVETELSNEGSYTFTATTGTDNGRFMLRVGGTVITSISGDLRVKSEKTATAPCYNLNGQRIVAPQKGLYIVNGKKIMK